MTRSADKQSTTRDASPAELRQAVLGLALCHAGQRYLWLATLGLQGSTLVALEGAGYFREAAGHQSEPLGGDDLNALPEAPLDFISGVVAVDTGRTDHQAFLSAGSRADSDYLRATLLSADADEAAMPELPVFAVRPRPMAGLDSELVQLCRYLGLSEPHPEQLSGLLGAIMAQDRQSSDALDYGWSDGFAAEIHVEGGTDADMAPLVAATREVFAAHGYDMTLADAPAASGSGEAKH